MIRQKQKSLSLFINKLMAFLAFFDEGTDDLVMIGMVGEGLQDVLQLFECVGAVLRVAEEAVTH